MSALARKRRHTDLPTPSLERKADAQINEARKEIAMLGMLDEERDKVRYALSVWAPKTLVTFDAWQAAKAVGK